MANAVVLSCGVFSGELIKIEIAFLCFSQIQHKGMAEGDLLPNQDSDQCGRNRALSCLQRVVACFTCSIVELLYILFSCLSAFSLLHSEHFVMFL
jgi:hypothetical protein